jgi:hypothetical protein
MRKRPHAQTHTPTLAHARTVTRTRARPFARTRTRARPHARARALSPLRARFYRSRILRSAVLVATRERPQLVWDAAHVTPTHLVTAVTGGVSWCWDNGQTPCVNCKYQFWDYSLVQPLDLS